MRQTKITKNTDSILNISDVPVLIIDDERSVRDTIKFYAKEKGYTKFDFAGSIEQATKLIDEKNFHILSADYDMEGQQIEGKLADGIGLLKFLLPDCNPKPKGSIIYTAVAESKIDIKEKTWCKEVGIPIIPKSKMHETLFEAIELFLKKPSHLPEKPKYANMKNDELLICLANDLVKELESNKDSHFSFGSDTNPMKNSDVVKEIKSLTPLGKEVLGNWFSGVKRNLDFLHRDRLKSKKA